ncbi:MAG: CoA transferase [Chloroflexi bacterium]|nr:CoA transferase [Chloroflexota bacterium]
MNKQALTGVKVLEYAQFVAGPYCTKLLADLGAEVIKIEPPGAGDRSRNQGPFPNDIPHAEKSALFLYLNTNKLGVTLDTGIPTGKEIFHKLVENVDVLIDDNHPQQMRELGFDYATLRQINPRLVMTSIAPFGQNGPHTEYKACPLNLVHAGMLGYMTPWVSRWPDREPLQPGGMLGEYGAGLSAATATLAALYVQRMSGEGQHVDVSKQEAILALNRVNAPQFPNDGESDTRFVNLSGLLGDIVPCKDGHIVFQINETHHWKGFVQLIGNPEWARDPVYLDGAERGRRFQTEIRPRVIEWAKAYTKEDLYHKGQAANCPFAVVNSAEDIVNSEHLKSRGFFVDVDHPAAGKIKQPGAPFIMSETPWQVQSPAPLLGQHNEQVYCDRLGYDKHDLLTMRKAGII